MHRKQKMADDTLKMKILRDCFVSDKTVIVRDGHTIERRKVFAGEEIDMHIDDATLLDEKGFAKQVMERRRAAVKPNDPSPSA